MTFRLILFASLTMVAAGCATLGDFTEQAEKANVAVERTQNNMLLLNAVRASQRRPMHFTSMSTVKAPIGEGSTSVQLGLPALGVDRVGKRIYAPQLTYKPDTPIFDVTVWDGQGFIRGITTPVDPKTFVYYLDQGWPMQLLMSLLVREIRVLDSNGNVVKQYVNYPESVRQFGDFQAAALEFSSCEFFFSKKKDTVNYGPPLAARNVTDPAAIAKVREQNLLLSPTTVTVREDGKDVKTTMYQVAKEDESQVLKFRDRPLSSRKCAPLGVTAETSVMTSHSMLHDVLQFIEKLGLAGTPKPTNVITFSMRSPEAALYFLGELARVQLMGAVQEGTTEREIFTPTVDLGIPPEHGIENMFTVKTGAVPRGEHPAAVAEYDGATYWIPGDPVEGGRSMRMLTLVHQLINLQKDAKDLPATTTIRITQ